MTEQAVEQHHRLERDILAAMSRPTKWYWVALGVSVAAFLMGMALWLYMILTGMGVAGINNPVGWGVFIVDFVFWVGIAHSGTLISAVLFLFRARFRNRFNRAAEAMTIFAVMTAGLFPLIHLGRVWFAYWLFPYPNNHLIWPNFKSPLVWDVFAVSTYLTVSAVFWYVGLIPDLAIARRHAKNRIQMWAYRVFSLGWVGSVQQWKHYNKLYGLLACFATPLVVSVHSVVSWDFAMSVIPGWHTTIFAPYFVAGAILSGCAMVITLMVPMRKFFRLEEIITVKHFEGIAQMLLLTSLIVTYSYVVEYAIAFYSGNTYEISHFVYRLLGADEPGHYRYAYWVMVACNSALPLLLFFRRVRTSIPALFVLSLFVNVGMWLERFIIIVTSLARDFDPYAWGLYKPTIIEVGITIGSFGLFFTLFLLFCKALPVLAITEIKEEYLMQEYRFEDEHSYLHKLQELVDSGVPARRIHAFSPIPVPAAEQILREKPTFVRVFAIAGALLGMVAGFALCIYTVLRYPLIVGGKPVVSILPFVVIAFELTILLGSLATFAGFLLNARLPYIPRIFNPDEYGTHFTILVEEER